MYTILLNDQNELVATSREVIMQRSKLVKQLRFLVPQTYHGLNMEEFSVLMQFKLPVSHKCKGKILNKESELYMFSGENYLQYIINLDTDITSEAGNLEVFLSFGKVGMDEDGAFFQQVEKTSETNITITPITAWADLIPDELLDPVDQRLIAVEAMAKQYEQIANTVLESHPVDIALDVTDETIKLKSENGNVGKGVAVSDISKIIEGDFFPEEPDDVKDGVIRLDDLL